MVRWTGTRPGRQCRAGTRRLRHDSARACRRSLATLTTIIVLGLGGREVAMGSLSIGALVAFQTLLASFNQPFRDLARLGSQVQELRADLDRIDDVRHHAIDPVLRCPASLARQASG